MLFRLICGASAESVGNCASAFRGRVGPPPYPGSLLTADRIDPNSLERLLRRADEREDSTKDRSHPVAAEDPGDERHRGRRRGDPIEAVKNPRTTVV